MCLTSIKSDIDKMPLDLIDDLVDALAVRAKDCSRRQPTAGVAAQMHAGWLKARALERRSEGSIHEYARQIKEEHAKLFNEVLLNQYASISEIPRQSQIAL